MMFSMSSILLVSCFIAVVATADKTPRERAEIMVKRMNLTEKVRMMHGHMSGDYIGNIYDNSRLGIPAIKMQDGPQGFRVTATTGEVGSTTAWPTALSAAASWDTELLYRWAAAMASEFKIKGANVQLGPGIGIARVPTAGRNFEYLCGEDPFFGSVVVVPVVKGIQDQGIMANAKHFINNEIEENRKGVSSDVDERTRFEIYYPPFQSAVEAGVLSVMCAYNRINGIHACENADTLHHLKDVMKFPGWVMSDWIDTYSTVESLHAGLDVEMPLPVFYSEVALVHELKEGSISINEIDESVTRILTSMYAIGLFDGDIGGSPDAVATSPEHNALAREISAKSTVLLKNAGDILPLSKSALKKVCVFGDNSTISGGGSGKVTPAYIINAEAGVRAALSNYEVEVEYNNGKDVDAASALAASCDVALVVVATSSGEGNDRPNLSLGNNQDELVDAIASSNPVTIVSVVTPGAVLMPFSDKVAAILISWLPGQEMGNALADVLFGDVNPSGRLHVTMPNKDNEINFSREQYPGTGIPPVAVYSEKLLVGYRYYDAYGITPKYCYGHGLSYTIFSYTDLSIAISTSGAVDVTFKVTNSGDRDGAEVPQLYLTFPETAGEPASQLKGFTKVYISSKDTIGVKMTLSLRDMSIWNAETHSWNQVFGDFGLKIGASSRDIRLESSFSML